MRTTIDGAGRVVIPKPIRERLGLEAGGSVEIRERDGLLELVPAASAMSLERRSGGLVAVPAEPLPPLTDAMVRATIEGTRR
jgi:AbrB family looped-hinge helix DNA binding protein